MKLAIICDSPLLDRCLEYYLREHVTSYRQCDFIVSDKPLKVDKPLCLISTSQDAYIPKPFTRTQLILGLEAFFKSLKLRPPFDEISEGHQDFALKKRIEEATSRFSQELYWMITEHYEGKR